MANDETTNVPLFPKGGGGLDLPFTPEQLVQEGVPSAAEPADATEANESAGQAPTPAECLAEELQQVERDAAQTPPSANAG
jgi:hypothetical protein